jgi:acetyl-CoA acetyltransferase
MMTEAVIVEVARAPIGCAFKGSLRDLRPDDLAASIVRAALDKVPLDWVKALAASHTTFLTDVGTLYANAVRSPLANRSGPAPSPEE